MIIRHNNHYNLEAMSVFCYPSRHGPPSQVLRQVSFTTSSCAAINDEKRFVAMTITKLTSTWGRRIWRGNKPGGRGEGTT